MNVIINNTYSNTNVGINEENSFMVATSKRALAQRARREREKTTTTFHLQMINNIHRDVYFNGGTSTQQYLQCQEPGNKANVPHASLMNDVNNHWNTVNELLHEPFMDEHFFNDDNMDSDFENNVDPLIHESRHYLGNMDVECPLCHALHWLDGKLINSSRYRPLFGTCCKQGKIRLPILQPLPPAIQVLYDNDSSYVKSFQSHIREYNAANAFTNLGVKLDDQILNGRGLKPFSIYGELKHRIRALLPDLGKQAAYAQLYIYDSAATLNARVSHNPQLNTDVLQIIQDNLMEYNSFVRIYRQTYEILNDVYSADNQNVNVHAHLHYSLRTDRRRYNIPSTDEIAVILPGDG
ncbi:hypothetical protein GIB67_012159 [Kingdonia uniflora]|uniref:Helitron helicase-like domain-containing protein n=1 Tax=Kingdonia uniflora TaxID=39325 RepID=A0A7J7NNI3_9MAGN|nr:hypothetical protein GIB67_012159 [Kingdonia uniflora]